jgi:hypothetical protein
MTMLWQHALAGLAAILLVQQLALLRPAWAVFDEIYEDITQDLPEERDALITLYNNTGGPGWVLPLKQGGAPWNTNTSYCR